MRVRWTRAAVSDLSRLYEYLACVDRRAAARAVGALRAALAKLLMFPRRGFRLAEFDPREVRRVIVGGYEIRYELRDDALLVLSLWHTREDR